MQRHRVFLASLTLGICLWAGYQFGGKSPTDQTTAKVTPAESSTKVNARPAEVFQRAETALKPLFEVEGWLLCEPNTAPLAPTETLASRQVSATTVLKPGTLPVLGLMRAGQAIGLPAHGSAPLAAEVASVSRDADWMRVAGALDDGGSFFLSQNGPAFFGRILQPGLGRAYLITTRPDGTVVMEQKPFASVRCAAIPRKPKPTGYQTPAQAPVRSIESTTWVPVLDSDPSLPNVIYLDFDGETVTDPDWNNGHPINAVASTLKGSRITSTQITDIWNRVVEDYRPFKISITTDVNRYNAAGARHRIRCIITSTDTAAPGAGGVAWIGSFREAGLDFSSTVPCWAFTEDYYTTADISGIISHEVGHTMGLSHDGRANPYEEYFEGQGSGPTSWAPIMGATYDHMVTQWSRGEYYRANNHEDDIAIIGGAANGFGFVADEDNASTPLTLPNNGLISVSGVITTQADVDQYVFATAGGLVRLDATPAAVEPDLDIKLEIRDRVGVTVLASGNPIGSLGVNMSATLPLGTYRLVIRGTGEGSPLAVGYSSYGSVGAYAIHGSYPTIPVAAPVITTQPVSTGALAGARVILSVAATSAVPPAYQWQKNGADIPGQTGSTLVFASLQAVNQGTYRCVASNIAGSAASDPAVVSVFSKPAITKQPAAVSTTAGSATPLTLSVTAAGTPPLRYQWQRNTVNVAGQTDATLSLANPQWADGGSYRCVVTNDYGTVVSTAVVAVVFSPPIILTQPPVAKELPKGGVSSIAVAATGSSPLYYQWYKDSNKITGAVAATLGFSRIADAASGAYHCVVTNRLASTPSNECAITVGIAPVITLQPVALTVHEGSPFQLTVAATGSGTLAYQWQRDGVNMGTGTTFSVAAATWNDHGTYRCVVSNGAGTAISKAVPVMVQAGPIILTPPAGGKIAIGAKTTLKVVATGSATLKYQWRKDGVNLPGATLASLVITGAANASYDVVVSNPFNPAGVVSPPAQMVALAAPKIVQQPVAASVPFGMMASFAVQASGGGTLSYQWKKNGVAMSGQTAPSLSWSVLNVADAASYTVTVTNEVGAATSLAARLTILNPPKIVKKPASITAKTSGEIVLTASATGSGTLLYHWQKDNADIIGCTSATFTIPHASTRDSGSYRAVVSNSAGTVYSDAARVTVLGALPPGVTGFRPSQGPVGSLVRISGSSLDETTRVTMLSGKGSLVEAGFVVVSGEQLLVSIPPGAASSAFTIEGAGGKAASAQSFAITAAQANDDFANAQIIPSGGKILTGSNAAMTAEADEPFHALPEPGTDAAYAPAHSAWYSWTPGTSGPCFVSTSGSSFATRVAIYTGGTLKDLVEVAANEKESDATVTSRVEFNVAAGTEYFIAVDGFAARETVPEQSGEYSLQIGPLDDNEAAAMK